MADESFIRELAGSLKERIATADAQMQKDARDTAIIKTEGPKDWLLLKKELEDAISDLVGSLPSGVLSFTQEDSNHMEIRCLVGDQAKITKITFISVLFADIKVEAPKIEILYEGTVQNRKLFWTERGKDKMVAIGDVAKRILKIATSA